jgi:hypothetical protein
MSEASRLAGRTFERQSASEEALPPSRGAVLLADLQAAAPSQDPSPAIRETQVTQQNGPRLRGGIARKTLAL